MVVGYKYIYLSYWGQKYLYLSIGEYKYMYLRFGGYKYIFLLIKYLYYCELGVNLYNLNYILVFLYGWNK